MLLKTKWHALQQGDGTLSLLWVGGCFWDSGTLTLYQTMFKNILQS